MFYKNRVVKSCLSSRYMEGGDNKSAGEQTQGRGFWENGGGKKKKKVEGHMKRWEELLRFYFFGFCFTLMTIWTKAWLRKPHYILLTGLLLSLNC